MYYEINLPQVRNIFNYFKGSDILLTKTKWTLDDTNLLRIC